MKQVIIINKISKIKRNPLTRVAYSKDRKKETNNTKMESNIRRTHCMSPATTFVRTLHSDTLITICILLYVYTIIQLYHYSVNYRCFVSHVYTFNYHTFYHLYHKLK